MLVLYLEESKKHTFSAFYALRLKVLIETGFQITGTTQDIDEETQYTVYRIKLWRYWHLLTFSVHVPLCLRMKLNEPFHLNWFHVYECVYTYVHTYAHILSPYRETSCNYSS